MQQFGAGERRWTDCLNAQGATHSTPHQVPLIGVIPGEGIGPEVMAAALDVLDAVVSPSNRKVETYESGPIGREAERLFDTCLPREAINFCEGVFERGGAILHGPGGGRFVYDFRRQFDLFIKITPLRNSYAAPGASSVKPHLTQNIDVLVTRENLGGIYQGTWKFLADKPGERVAQHFFTYTEDQVDQFLSASARLAKQRRGSLAVVVKESGIPSISELWRECAERVAAKHNVQYSLIDIDLMAYRLVQQAKSFDVIAAPNLFGDVLGDLGAVLLGSRGIAFSGNYSKARHSAYQTNHGAAYDIAGSDCANPAAQIFSLAMMLRESFELFPEAAAIEQAVKELWDEGWRTEDVTVMGSVTIGTREMGYRIAERAAGIIDSHRFVPAASVDDETAARLG